MRSYHPWVFKILTLPLASSQDCSALVQSRSPIVQSRRVDSVDSGGSQTTSLTALAQMEAELNALAAADPQGWSQDQVNKLNEFLVTANIDMVGVLNAERTADQQEWDSAAVQRKNCHDSTEKRFMQGGDVFHEARVRDSKKEVHKSCRKLEVAWNSYTSAVEGCDTASTLVWTDTSPPALSSSHASLFAAMEAFQTEKSSYAALEPSQPTCSAAQLDYESQYCSWRKSKRFACQGEASCITLLNMTSKRNSLQTRVTQRRSLRLTLTRLICHMTHLLNTFQSQNESAPEEKSDFAMSNNCSESAVDDTLDDLNFTLSASSYCVSDSDVALYPSDASCNGAAVPGATAPWFMDATFGYGWNASYVVPSTCRHKCVDTPDAGPSPSPTPGCIDSAGEVSDCVMFDHHRDACSHNAFKVNGFDPAVECCVCGGGTLPTTTTTTTTTTGSQVLMGVCPLFSYNDCGWAKQGGFRCGGAHGVRTGLSPKIAVDQVAHMIANKVLLKDGTMATTTDNKPISISSEAGFWQNGVHVGAPFGDLGGRTVKRLVQASGTDCVQLTDLTWTCHGNCGDGHSQGIAKGLSGKDIRMLASGVNEVCALIGDNRDLLCQGCGPHALAPVHKVQTGPFTSVHMGAGSVFAKKADGGYLNVGEFISSSHTVPNNIGNIKAYIKIPRQAVHCVVHDGSSDDGGGTSERNGNGVKCWGLDNIVLPDKVKNSNTKPWWGHSPNMEDICLIYEDELFCFKWNSGEDRTSWHAGFEKGIQGSDSQCDAVQFWNVR